jgi:hypothetical protein
LLYSGQVDVSNLGEAAFATYFEEYPGNAGPVGDPMGMPIKQALASFMKPGSRLRLKSVMSFTDSLTDAQHYSNGIIVTIQPLPGSEVWAQCAYITSLSNEANKIEYVFPKGATFVVVSHGQQEIGDKVYTTILLEEI